MVQCDLIKLHTTPHSVVQFTITCGAVQLLHFETDFGRFGCNHVVPNHILEGGSGGWGGGGTFETHLIP